MLIDKKTGRTVGEPLKLDKAGAHLTGDVQVWPGRLVLQTTDGIVAYETTTAQAGAATGDGVN